MFLAAVALSAKFAADDWCAVAGVRANGLAAPLALYDSWSGRYTANLVIGIVGVLGPQLAWVVPMLAAAGLLGALLLVLREHPDAAIGAVALLVIVAPARWQDFGWPTGAASYVVGLALAVGVFVAIRRPGLAAAIAFLAAGTSETLAVALIAMLAVGLRFGVPRVVFAGGLLGLVVMAVAPGNVERAALIERPDLAGVVVGLTMGIAAIAIPLVLALAVRLATGRRAPVVGIVGAMASLVPSAVLIGAAPPDRALIVPFACLLGSVGWIYRDKHGPLWVAAAAVAGLLLLTSTPGQGLSGPTVPYVAACIRGAGG